MLNLQVIEKQHLNKLGFLQIHHIFKTIQGEGPFAGIPAIFIRMSGCNLQCPLCDTDYTSQVNLMSPEMILRQIDAISGSTMLVVISGGEPLRQNIVPLIERLLGSSYTVQIETNGTLWVPGLQVEDLNLHVVCSPKTGKIDSELAPHIDAFKYILHADYIDPEDGLPLTALNHTASPKVARPPLDIYGDLEDMGHNIYVQPVDVGRVLENARHLQAAIDSCLKYNYTLCIQTQKIIGME